MSGQQGTFGEGVAPRWGYQTSFWQRRQPAFWLFVVSVALTGFVMLGQQLEMIGVAPDAWLLTLVLLVPYAVPVVLVVYWLDLYEREPVSILAAALVWGGVVATTLSIYTNTPLAELIFKLTGDAVFTSEWSAALTAPFVEEGFKALGIILLVSIFCAFAGGSSFESLASAQVAASDGSGEDAHEQHPHAHRHLRRAGTR